jgi:hypothetical protein
MLSNNYLAKDKSTIEEGLRPLQDGTIFYATAIISIFHIYIINVRKEIEYVYFNSLSKIKEESFMTNYIDITKNTKNIPGRDIEEAMLGKKFIRIIRGKGKEVIPCNSIKINRYSIYNITDNGNRITITAGNGWTCTQKEYNNIINSGNEIINDIFGDIFEKTKNIK